MAGNIIKEFLVRLGFDVDSAGLHRFGSGISGATKSVAELTGGLVAMATAVTAAVSVTARQFDHLYYLSQRTASSADNLSKFGYAAKQVGLTVGQFTGQAEGLARMLRDAPYVRAWVTSVTGAAGDTTNMIERLATWYREQMKAGQYQEMYARMMLNQWGIDSEMVRQIAVNLDQFKKSQADYSQWLRDLGFTQQKASELGVEYQRGINELWTKFSLMWEKMVVTLLPTMNRGLSELNRYVTEHMGDIGHFIDDVLRPWITWLGEPATWQGFRSEVSHIRDEFDAWGVTLQSIKGILMSVVRVFDDNPILARVLIGAYVGGRLGGLRGAAAGAVVGAGSAMVGPETTAEQENRRRMDRQLGTLSPLRLFDQMRDWLSGATHSPNVDIYEARGLWTRLRDWLLGSDIAPYVRIKAAGGRGPTTAAHHPAGRFGGMAPSVARASGATPASIGGAGAATARVARPAGAIGPQLPSDVFEAISQAEGTTRNGQINYDDTLAHGRILSPPKPISQMTLDELDKFQTEMLRSPKNRWNSSASGAFQIIRTTMREMRKRLGLKGSDVFSPEVQRRVASEIWKTQGSRAWEGFKAHEDLRSRARALAGRPPIDASPPGASAASYDNSRVQHVAMNPTTTINVYGGDDNTGQAVASAQRRVNADGIRNLSTAVA